AAGAGCVGGAGGAGGAGRTAGARGTRGATCVAGTRAASPRGAGGAGGTTGAGGAGAAGAGGAGAAAGAGVAGTTPQSLFPQLLPHSPLPAPAPYTSVTESLTERREPGTRDSTPERREPDTRASTLEHREPETRASVCAHVPCVQGSHAPAVPCTHDMTLHPSSVPQRVVLPSPPASSLPAVADPPFDLTRASSPTVTLFLATVVMDPTLLSPVASALVAELVDFATVYRLDYLAGGAGVSCGRCTSSRDHAGDPDALDIPTPRSYRKAISGEYSSQWQTATGAEMASWKSTGTYVDEGPPPGANIVSGMWIFKVKRPPGPPPAFKVHYVARGFRQPQRDYELHSLDFSTAFLQSSLHEAIWLRRPPIFSGSFPERTQWSLWRPVYGMRQEPHEWHDTMRTTLAPLGFAPSTADPSLFLHTDTTLPPFYVLVDVDDLVFATADTEALALCTAHHHPDSARRTITVHQVLQRFAFQFSSPQPTPLSTGHSLSAPPSDESVEPSGLYPELVGCLITLGMGLVLGGRGSVVLIGHSDASWADDQATQRLSEGYTFSLGCVSVSWRSTRSSSMLDSSYETETYAGAMAAQELRWLTYLLTDLGEQPLSPPVLYVDKKAMLALCQKQRLEHRTKLIALCYFLACELLQPRQLHLSYVASQANIADDFTKALGSGDHQRFCTALGLVPTLPHLLVA
ncbi:unnamed protein product, partial [Closterium sp. NIES-53]